MAILFIIPSNTTPPKHRYNTLVLTQGAELSGLTVSLYKLFIFNLLTDILLTATRMSSTSPIIILKKSVLS